ncbi:MAG: hypothetical protein ACW98F_02355 [Candidatus Hodarchaeales archaeon]|jgi:hypothetical protein
MKKHDTIAKLTSYKNQLTEKKLVRKAGNTPLQDLKPKFSFNPFYTNYQPDNMMISGE